MFLFKFLLNKKGQEHGGKQYWLKLFSPYFFFPALFVTSCVPKAKKKKKKKSPLNVTVTWKVEHSNKINIHSHRRTTVENCQGLKCSYYPTVFSY